MSFDVARFSAEVSALGGLQKASKFEARVYPRTGAQMRFFKFMCQAADLPGVTSALTDSRPLGYGSLVQTPLVTSYEALPLTLTLDNAGLTLSSMLEWYNRTVNKKYVPGGALRTARDGSYPFQVGYKKDYAAEVEVDTFDDSGSVVCTHTFHEAWPVSLGTIRYSWAAVNQLAILPVSLVYTSWTSSLEGKTRDDTEETE